MTTSKDKSKYTCTECGKNYATSSNLSRHKQTHRSLDSTNAKKCHVCGKMYVSMPALSMHILTHNLSHKCNVCGKAFSKLDSLRRHVNELHKGVRPFACSVCNKNYGRKDYLDRHVRTHDPANQKRKPGIVDWGSTSGVVSLLNRKVSNKKDGNLKFGAKKQTERKRRICLILYHPDFTY